MLMQYMKGRTKIKILITGFDPYQVPESIFTLKIYIMISARYMETHLTKMAGAGFSELELGFQSNNNLNNPA